MDTEKKYQRFVIIGTARTGTTLLWSYMNSHPDILCLRGVYGSTNKINFGKYYDILPDECTDNKLINERNNSPVKFIKEYVFKEYSQNYMAVGFKYFYDHDRHLKNKDDILNYFVENKDIKFVHIIRENLVETLYSYKRALNNKNWHQKEEKEFSIEIPFEECREYFENTMTQRNRFNELFKDRMFGIIYEDFIKQPELVLTKLQGFLNVPKRIIKTEIVKNFNIPLSKAIINYSELKEFFRDSEFKRFFN